MRRRGLPTWLVSFFWGKEKKRRRKYFKSWAIPKDQITDDIRDREWFKIQITGPGHEFRGIVKLTSAEEVPLPKFEADRLEKAMRKHPDGLYSIALISKAKARKG